MTAKIFLSSKFSQTAQWLPYLFAWLCVPRRREFSARRGRGIFQALPPRIESPGPTKIRRILNIRRERRWLFQVLFAIRGICRQLNGYEKAKES